MLTIRQASDRLLGDRRYGIDRFDPRNDPSFFKDIPGELHERPWVDFATNRNEALFLAKDRGDYLLFIDADETAVFSSDFQMPVLEKDFYSCSYRHGNLENQRILLIVLISTGYGREFCTKSSQCSLKTGGCFLKTSS